MLDILLVPAAWLVHQSPEFVELVEVLEVLEELVEVLAVDALVVLHVVVANVQVHL